MVQLSFLCIFVACSQDPRAKLVVTPCQASGDPWGFRDLRGWSLALRWIMWRQIQSLIQFDQFSSPRIIPSCTLRFPDCGRLGTHCFMDLQPRTTMKTMIPLPTLKYESVLVALKREIIQKGTEEDLESLMLLKHKSAQRFYFNLFLIQKGRSKSFSLRHLIKLEDFAMYPHGSVILRYEMHDNTSLYDIMRKKDFGMGTTLAWIQQVLSEWSGCDSILNFFFVLFSEISELARWTHAFPNFLKISDQAE